MLGMSVLCNSWQLSVSVVLDMSVLYTSWQLSVSVVLGMSVLCNSWQLSVSVVLDMSVLCTSWQQCSCVAVLQWVLTVSGWLLNSGQRSTFCRYSSSCCCKYKGLIKTTLERIFGSTHLPVPIFNQMLQSTKQRHLLF